jgi:hypothetical protein
MVEAVEYHLTAILIKSALRGPDDGGGIYDGRGDARCDIFPHKIKSLPQNRGRDCVRGSSIKVFWWGRG